MSFVGMIIVTDMDVSTGGTDGKIIYVCKVGNA